MKALLTTPKLSVSCAEATAERFQSRQELMLNSNGKKLRQKCACRPLDRRVVLDSIAGHDRKTTPPKTPFANVTLQDAELLSVEGNNLGDRLPGCCLSYIMLYFCDLQCISLVQPTQGHPVPHPVHLMLVTVSILHRS